MDKIAVMGDYDSIYGFAALGLSVYPADSKEEGARLLKELSKECGIIYITEAMAALLKEELEACAGQRYPAVILIPGVSENTGEGISQVRRSVERAVGSDILFSE